MCVSVSFLVLFNFLCLSNALFAQQQVVYKPLYTEEAFNNRALDVNLPVGSMAGEAGVANGAAMYHIPIVVPPGTNGVVPNLSINYNSMGGNGILGRGWSLAGLSSIRRVPGRLYYDEDVFPVNLDANDRFSLDGQHLIGLTGTYGADGATYGAEVEDFSVISSHGVFGSGPQHFTVVTKQGVIYEYGKSTNSIVKSNNQHHVLEWKLNRISYPDGNLIEYSYTNNGMYIDAIIYVNEEAFVEFNYEERSDKNTVYIAGNVYTHDLLLTSIVTKAEGLVAGSYHFEYGYQDHETYLIEVERRGNDGIGFNSTIFKYGENSLPFEKNTLFLPFIQDYTVYPGDFDANGFTDLLAVHYEYHYIDENENDSIPYATHFRVLRNNGGAYSALGQIDLPPASFTNINKMELPTQNDFKNFDFTGDGRSDVMMTRLQPGIFQGSMQMDIYRIYSQNGSNPSEITFTYTDYPAPSVSGYGTFNRFNYEAGSGNFAITGDFDGDGRSDVLFILSNGTGFKPFLSFPGKGIMNEEVNIPDLTGSYLSGIWLFADEYNVIDFTGDGRDELMITKGAETKVFRFEVVNGQWEAKQLYTSGFPTKWHLMYFGDFNGDGITDILYRTSKTNPMNPWGIAYGTGTGFIEEPFQFITTPIIVNDNGQGSNCDEQIVIVDISGNGKSDIIHFKKEQPPQGFCRLNGMDTYMSSGQVFDYVPQPLVMNLNLHNDILPYIPIDIYGDGKVNLFQFRGGSACNVISLNKGSANHLLKATKNGLNHKSAWKYKRMTESGAYTRDAITNYPVNTIRAPLSLVHEFTSYQRWTKYHYKNARLHRLKGLLGFESVTTTDIPKDARIIQYQEYDLEMEALLPVLIESYRKKWNGQYELIQDVTLDFDIENLGAKQYKMQLTQKTVNNYLSGSTLIEQVLDYDNYGNPTEMETDINGIETVTVSMQYGQFGTPVPAHVVSSTSTTTRTGQAPFILTTTMDYSSFGQLIEKVDFVEMANELVVEYEYYNNGTLEKKSVSTIGSNGFETRTSAYEYDNYGRYAVSSENALNQTTFEAEYDPRNGNVLSYTDIDGLLTTYEYDGFGRLLKIVDVSKNYEVQETLAWSINSTLNSIYKHTVQHPGHLNTINYYDVLGRNVKKEAPGFLGTFLPPPVGSYPLAPLSQQLTTYGIDGSVYMQTRPHYQGEDAMPVTNDLDEYGRVWFVYSDYGTTEYVYSYDNGNETVTVTAPSGETSSTTTDATGKVIQVSDNGGTLQYQYYSHSGLRKVIQNSTALVEMEYDEYGRQTKLIDGSAGTILYEYDGFGQLISQTNAKNEVQTMDYDLLGRVVTQTLPEGSKQYTYKNNAPGINLPEMVLGIDGGETHYSYDNFGRIASVEEIIDGESFTMHFEYDKYDRLTKRIFPTGYALRYFYDSNGNLSHIFSDDTQTQFYTAYESNGQGQMINWTAGNGKSSEISYYKGFPVNLYTPGVQDLDMQWELSTGNLLQRHDVYKYKVEEFTYDNLDRLTNVNLNNGLPDVTLQYMPNGSPTFFDLPTIMNYGDYYNPGPRNAVVNAENLENIISTDLQHIQYTSFKQPRWIKESGYEQNFWYGSDMQRRKSVLEQNQQQIEERIYLGSYERVKIGTQTHHLHYVSAGGKLIAIVNQNRNGDDYYYTYTDHLGSIVALTDENGTVIAEQNFDAWGNHRNPDTWTYDNIPAMPAWFNRGFTGHEHMPQFALINMNGRMYDPLLNRMLSPDNYVQAPYSTQSYNRFSYAFNNPLKYTDPDGEIVLPIFLYFTEVGYDIQKFLLPVAYKVDLPTGTHIRGIGVQASFGIPQMVTYSARIHGSLGYYKFDFYSSDEPIPAGMQYTLGYEFGFADLVTVGSTKYWTPRSPHLNQKLAHVRLGLPTFNIKYSNDMSFGLPFGDGGDRHRTAAFQARAGILSAGIKFFTGDPGLNWKDRNIDESKGGKAGLYLPNIFGDDPDQYRAGIGYIGIGPIKFGNDRESRRHRIQNELIHDLLLHKDPSPHFQVLDIPNRFYFQFLSGGGFLW